MSTSNVDQTRRDGVPVNLGLEPAPPQVVRTPLVNASLDALPAVNQLIQNDAAPSSRLPTRPQSGVMGNQCDSSRIVSGMLPSLYAVAHGVLREFGIPDAHESAWDVVQDWASQFFRKGLARYDTSRPLEPYARQGVRYVAIHFALAEQRRSRRNIKSVDLAGLAATDCNSVEADESTADLRSALQDLPTELQEVIRLRFLENIKFEDIGKCLHFSAATAHRRVHMAIEQLHAAIVAQRRNCPKARRQA